METEGRKVKDGREFERLFPPPSEGDITIKKDADVEDTMALIQRTVPQTLWHTKKIAQKLKGKTLEQTCSNIWQFVYEHIQYRKDEDGVEQVRSPRRTWWERERGVDCDCYTEFISSILLNLNIPHKARITKYPKLPPEVPRWQHVYPIVPKSGRLDGVLERDDYIVVDCVKDDFDDEQPFLECKDYNMRLDYLDGVDQDDLRDNATQDDLVLMGPGYSEPASVDMRDLAAVYDDADMGRLFKKLGRSLKKLGEKVKNGVRFINRFTNPGTILLRNGFLLSMKLNLLNVAGRLRYAYLTDAKAKAMGMNLNALNKLRKVKDRAETIYWQAGGKKENLKKAILNGKGNKDKKVSMQGLFGLDNVYADADEYHIIHSDGTSGLGELGIVAATAIAAATSAVAAIAGALKQVKGLFNKGGGEAAMPAPSVQAEDQFNPDQAVPSRSNRSFDDSVTPPSQNSYSSAQDDSNPSQDEESQSPQDSGSNAPDSNSFSQDADSSSTEQDFSPPSQNMDSSSSDSDGEQSTPGETQSSSEDNGDDSSSLSDINTSIARRGTTALVKQSSDTSLMAIDNKPQGIVAKTATWVKANPGKSLLIAGSIVSVGFLLFKSMHSHKSNEMNGLPTQHRRKRKKHKSYHKKTKVKRTNLF